MWADKTQVNLSINRENNHIFNNDDNEENCFANNK